MFQVLGVDIGTSVVKAAIVNGEGRELAVQSERVPYLDAAPGHAEIDPEAVWQATVRVIRGVLETSSLHNASIDAVGISGVMGGFWPVGRDRRAVRPAIAWPDERTHSDLAQMASEGIVDQVFALSGSSLIPGNPLMLLRHFDRHAPDILDRTHKVLLAKDYLRMRLTDVVATDPSDLSWFPAEIRKGQVTKEMLDLFGVTHRANLIPEAISAFEMAGRVTPEAALQTGLAEGTPVITGMSDAVSCAAGVGVIEPGASVIILGSACVNIAVQDRPDTAPDGLGFTWAMWQGRWARVLPNTSGTISLDWYFKAIRKHLYKNGEIDFHRVQPLLEASRAGANGLVFLPYVNGSGVLAPFYDPEMRGALAGLSQDLTENDFMRCPFEALAMATRDCFSAFPRHPDRVVVTGGGAANHYWMQMFADIMGIPVTVMESSQSGAIGTTMMAGLALGQWADLDSAVRDCVRIRQQYEPNTDGHRAYEPVFARYRAFRDELRFGKSESAGNDLKEPKPADGDVAGRFVSVAVTDASVVIVGAPNGSQSLTWDELIGGKLDWFDLNADELDALSYDQFSHLLTDLKRTGVRLQTEGATASIRPLTLNITANHVGVLIISDAVQHLTSKLAKTGCSISISGAHPYASLVAKGLRAIAAPGWQVIHHE